MASPLAQVFEGLCHSISDDINDAMSFAHRLLYGEETITERFLLDLTRRQSSLPTNALHVLSIAHKKQGKAWRSEPVTGADWEWHFTTPLMNKWFSVRVQAKKSQPYAKNILGYGDIATIPVKDINNVPVPQPRQIEKLIAQAKIYRCWPVYALYDFQFGDTSPQLTRCATCPRKDIWYNAVSYADAYQIQMLVDPERLDRDTVRKISAPMPCIVDCPFVHRPRGSLPQVVFDFAYQLQRRAAAVLGSDPPPLPALGDRMPPHVAAMLEVARSQPRPGPIYRVNGQWRADAGGDDVPGAAVDDGPDPFEDLAGVVIVRDNSAAFTINLR